MARIHLQFLCVGLVGFFFFNFIIFSGKGTRWLLFNKM